MTDQTRALTRVERPELEIQATAHASRAVFLPENFAQAMQMADLMARGLGVRPWMRGKPEACFMVLQQAMRWGMDPYAVANKAYETNGTVAYESQLINAVINTSGAILGTLKIEWEGEASRTAPIQPQPRRRDNNDPRDPRNEPAQPRTPPADETLVCRVSGRLKSDPDDLKVLEQPLRTITIRNSPLWQTNPKLQLAYHATRSWARLYAPEILLGVYTPDELVDGEAAQIEARTTSSGPAAPDRRDFAENREDEGETAEFSTMDVDSDDSERQTGENGENNADSATEKPENAQSDAVSADNSAENGSADGAESGPSDVPNEGISAGAGEPEPADDAGLSDMPVEPLEWATWKRETLAEIEKIEDHDAFNALKSGIQPALDQADEPILEEIQNALADKLLSLPEKTA